MLSAMSSGHDGSLSTVHAGSPEEALRRVETLALMADVGLPHAAIREQVAGALDLVVHQARMPDGARRVVAVSEVVRVAGGPATRELYALRDGRPTWRAPLGDGLAARLAAAQRAAGGMSPAVAARRPGGGVRAARRLGGDRRRRAGARRCSRVARWLAPLLTCCARARADEPGAPPARAARRAGAAGRRAGSWPGRWAGLALGAAAPWAGARRRPRAPAPPCAPRSSAGAPAVARALADALAGGHSVRGALTAAARDGGVTGPAGEELRRVAAALALGERTEDVLRDARAPRRRRPAATRSSPRSCCSATPAATSPGCCATSRPRSRTRGRVDADARSATAQARFTALIVAALPVAGPRSASSAQPGFVVALARSPLTAAMVVARARAAGRRVRVRPAHRAGGHAA